MRSKLAVLIVFAAAMACSMLVMRQKRIEAAHQIAQSYQRIEATRYELWDLQSRIAQRIEARNLATALREANLRFEPTTPGVMPVDRREEPSIKPASNPISNLWRPDGPEPRQP